MNIPKFLSLSSLNVNKQVPCVKGTEKLSGKFTTSLLLLGINFPWYFSFTVMDTPNKMIIKIKLHFCSQF